MDRPWAYAVPTAAALLGIVAAFHTAPRAHLPPLDHGATGRAAAAATSSADAPPFPVPPGEERPAGRFHTLRCLQCRPHGDRGGGDGAGGGSGPGWVLVANASARPVFIPYAPGTCAAPLIDAFQFQYLAAPALTDRMFAASGASTQVDVRGNVRGEYEWAGNTLLSWGAHTARSRVPIRGEVSADWFNPQPCASQRGGPPPAGLLCEEQLVSLLGLHRGSRMGRVDRWVGVFDVALVTRGTLGWALDPSAYVVASGDAVSADGGGGDGTPSLVTYTDGNVLVGEAGLLSLGRAALADPSWLGPSVPGGLNASVDMLTTDNSIVQRQEGWAVHAGLDAGGVAGAPVNVSAHATPWLHEVAYALCASPVASFVGDARLCDGVRRRPPPPPVTLSADGAPVAARLNLAARPFRGQTGVSVSWTVTPAGVVPPAPPCSLPATLQWNDVRRQPIWLLGRGDLEVPRGGWSTNAAEVDLARRLGACRYTAARRHLSTLTKWPVSLTDRAAELSQTFHRDLFLVDPPAAPAENIDLILAGLVVVSEAVALLTYQLQPAQAPPGPAAWAGRRCRVARTALIIAAGGLSLLGVWQLDPEEQRGSNWRAAALRLDVRVVANETEQANTAGQDIDYSGRAVWHVESLFLVVRPGYRPADMRRLFVGLSVGYGVLTVLVVAKGSWRWAAGRRAAPAAAEERDAAPALIE